VPPLGVVCGTRGRQYRGEKIGEKLRIIRSHGWRKYSLIADPQRKTCEQKEGTYREAADAEEATVATEAQASSRVKMKRGQSQNSKQRFRSRKQKNGRKEISESEKERRNL